MHFNFDKNIIRVTRTSSAQRCFYSLRRLKTWTRIRMGENRLNGLALIHTHKVVAIYIEDVVNIVAKSSRNYLKISIQYILYLHSFSYPLQYPLWKITLKCLMHIA